MELVRFAARDPGGANVLAAILSECRFVRPRPCEIWALPRAAGALRHSGVPIREFSEDFHVQALAEAWQESPAAALITATSHYAPFEPALWGIARSHHCPSLALLDQWCNLERRFAHGWPDAIGAIDDAHAEAVARLGFPEEHILRIGTPFLSRLAKQRDTVKRSATVPPRAPGVSVLFVSEGIAADVAAGHNAPFGFDEFDAFAVVYEAVRRADAEGIAVTLAVKLHPYEDAENFARVVARLAQPAGFQVTVLDSSADPTAWVLWADLVVGITSMLLLEAMVLGKPVISVQPGLVRENVFAGDRIGSARTFTDAGQAREAIRSFLGAPDPGIGMAGKTFASLDVLSIDGCPAIQSWLETDG